MLRSGGRDTGYRRRSRAANRARCRDVPDARRRDARHPRRRIGFGIPGDRTGASGAARSLAEPTRTSLESQICRLNNLGAQRLGCLCVLVAQDTLRYVPVKTRPLGGLLQDPNPGRRIQLFQDSGTGFWGLPYFADSRGECAPIFSISESAHRRFPVCVTNWLVWPSSGRRFGANPWIQSERDRSRPAKGGAEPQRVGRAARARRRLATNPIFTAP